MPNDQTQITDQVNDSVSPLGGDVVYDLLMSGIEPELTSENTEHILELAKDDTPEERKERAERYARAFEEYDRQFAAAEREWVQQFTAYKRASFKALEEEVATKDQDYLSSLESSMSSL
jgi:hypothetical protein